MEKPSRPQDVFINPIDKDKVAENPHLLPYAHTVGGAIIQPIDRGKVKGRAMAAMYEQTDRQIGQLREQIELLARQAKAIHERVAISEEIYLSEMNFEPLSGHTYHLYRRDNGQSVLSMIGPQEWGSKMPLEFVASARLLADHTWEVLENKV